MSLLIKKFSMNGQEFLTFITTSMFINTQLAYPQHAILPMIFYQEKKML